MKLSEFKEDYTDLQDLYEFANENDIECVTEHMLSNEDYSDRIWDEIHEWGDGWESLGDWLGDLPSGYEYYWNNAWGDYEGLSDDGDFERIRDKIIEAMADEWDPEDSEYEELDESDVDNDEADEPYEYIEAPSEEEIFGLATFSQEVYVGETEKPTVDVNLIW